MDDGDALLAAIRLYPMEDTPRLAYADYLQERGEDRRAEFVRAGYNPAWIPVTPTGVQWEFLKSGLWWYGPRAGAGKTTALLMAALRDATHPEYRGLVLVPDLEWLMGPGGMVGTMTEWLGGAAEWVGRDRLFRFAHGAEVRFAATYWLMPGWGRGSHHFVGLDGASQVGGLTRERVRSIPLGFDGIPGRFLMVG